MINKVSANAYKFSFNSIDGKIVNLKEFKGKPILIINTASLCGFTNQYADIESLYDNYKEDGLVVIGIPSNDFGNQELSSNTKVKDFCTTNFDISFCTSFCILSDFGFVVLAYHETNSPLLFIKYL